MNQRVDEPIVQQWQQWLASADAPHRITAQTIAVYGQHLARFAAWVRETYDVVFTVESVTAYRLAGYDTEVL